MSKVTDAWGRVIDGTYDAGYRAGFEAARDAAAREIEESGAKWGTRILAERIRALVPGDAHGR